MTGNRGDIEIRDAVEDDLAAIVGLLADDPIGATRERNDSPVPEAYVRALRAIEAQAGNQVVVAVDGGAVVGCLQLTLIPGLSRTGMTRAQIEGVRVDRAHRGAGVGEALIEYAVGRAKEAGCGLVQLTTDAARPDAHRFYARLGFEASHVGLKRAL